MADRMRRGLPRRIPWVHVAGMVSLLLYLGLACLSRQFEVLRFMSLQERLVINEQGRPIWLFLTLFAMLSALYFALCHWSYPREKVCWKTIFGYAIAFRIVMLFSVPFLEIDLYRYSWDGAVTAQGFNPYAYSPEEVQNAVESPDQSESLNQLLELRDSSKPLEAVLGVIHFPEITTIYPPVSQGVFALAHWTTPLRAERAQRLIILKAWLTLFDLGTLVVLLLLLRELRQPLHWSLLYAWCPLVIKEVANSGHLDTITVFWSMLALLFLIRGCGFAETSTRKRLNIADPVLAAVTLALGIAAKLYPLVLAPLFFLVWWRHLGWKSAFGLVITSLLLSAVCLTPMFLSTQRARVETSSDTTELTQVQEDPLDEGLSPPRIESASTPGEAQQLPKAGLSEFLSRWEMNDFLFMLVFENLKPESDSDPTLWFVVVPNSWRVELIKNLRSRMEPLEGRNLLPLDLSQATDHQFVFKFTRLLTSAATFILALVFAHRAVALGTPRSILRAAFLTIGWFWLFLPTQNPWYWMWCVPLLPFVKHRAWWYVSAFLFLYYTRFWFDDFPANQSMFSTIYDGNQFFNFVVVPFEFLPILLWLTVNSLRDSPTKKS